MTALRTQQPQPELRTTNPYLFIASSHVADTYPYIAYEKPPLKLLPKGAILGTWSVSVRNIVRFILNKDVEIITGVLPGDVARAWIKDTIDLPIRRRKEDIHAHNYPIPLHAIRGYYPNISYVDIRKAYLGVISMGYDLEYLRGQYFAPTMRPVPIDISNHKLCYAITVAMSKSAHKSIPIWTGEKTANIGGFNVYSNPPLYNLASDILSSVAADVLDDMGKYVYYIHTDGYIVKTGYEARLLRHFHKWNFDGRIKARGKGAVFGVGSWRIGKDRTARRDATATNYSTLMPDKDTRKWLHDRVSKYWK